MFLQSDWPTIAAVNLPSGGAAYPLSTPGVRLKVEPIKNVWLLLAMLNGDPAGPGPGDEQLRNRYGPTSASAIRRSSSARRSSSTTTARRTRASPPR